MEDSVFELALPGVSSLPDQGRSDWEKAAAAVLRKSGRMAADASDAQVWAKLTRHTLDGIEIPPLGTPRTAVDLPSASRPTRHGAWDIRTSYADDDATVVGGQILEDLQNGATSLWVKVGAGGVSVAELQRALVDVLLDAAPIVLDAGNDVADAAQALARIAGETKLDPRSNLGIDAVGAHVRGESIDQEAMGAAYGVAEQLGIRAFVVDGGAVHDQGATDAQELGYLLAAAVHYLRSFEEYAVSPADAAKMIEFRLSATDEQFPTIAKLRAVRALWARVLELSGVPEEGRTMALHAVTSRPMMTAFDPWVNMLRTTVAAFAAGVAGADAITVLPFDDAIGLPDSFSRRIARNTSSLLVEEAHVARVSDPAGGAYAIEKLTADMAQAGWDEFVRIESDGDILEAWAELKKRIAAAVEQRDVAVATRKRPITGLTEFPNLGESLPERRPHPEGAPVARSYGHAFEKLRKHPTPKPVLLATMGPIAAHTARATFAANLFAAGGIDTVSAGASDDVAGAVAALGDVTDAVVCLCGPDPTYAEWGADLVAALRTAGARRVIVAGKADLGQDDSCAIGINALDFLNRTRAALNGDQS